MSKAPMAKRERDGWRIHTNTKRGFAFIKDDGKYVWVETTECGGVDISAYGGTLTPARAAQFAAKVAEIAARAAKEAKDGR